MPNDDLGQFPTPVAPNTDSPTTPINPDLSSSQTTDTSSSMTTPPTFDPPPSQAPDNTDTTDIPGQEQASAFEETPDEIPSVISAESEQKIIETQEPLEPSEPATPIFSSNNTPPPDYNVEPPAISTPEVNPAPVTQPLLAQEIPATITPKGGSSFGSLITIVLLLVAGIAIAGVVFLMSQSTQLKQQLKEITQTLNNQNTTVTPTPTSSIIEFTTPTPTPDATDSATPTLTLTPSTSITPSTSLTPTATINPSDLVLPLADASDALKVAINHLPNAQLILIKTENATNPLTASTKYYFRQDLSTKKYFYVLIEGSREPEVIDRSIYVTPDNNIPSLNDMVLGSTLGIDLDEALRIAKALCTSGLCESATVKAQYIKSGENVIWQLSFDPADDTKDVLIIQLNASTKTVLYKSPGF